MTETVRQAVLNLFQRYASETNKALAGAIDLPALATLYTDEFIGASPAGVMTGKKGREFSDALASGFQRNRAIGAREMTVRSLKVEPIDAVHAIAHVDWRATYAAREGEQTIDFTNVYLVRVRDGDAQVFGWITGDEEAELRNHGIV